MAGAARLARQSRPRPAALIATTADQPLARQLIPMSPPKPPGTLCDVWTKLRALTAARIALDRSGSSLATAPLLEFRFAHARARDAVNETIDIPRLSEKLAGLEWPIITIDSAAPNRGAYLLRPDLGRSLGPKAREALLPHAGAFDLAVVAADGLSAWAVERQAPPLLAKLAPLLSAERRSLAQLVLVREGRVAIGDSIAAILGAGAVVVLIGERPGLSAPDSLGVYVTWRPIPERTTDADRNCISNIRPEGLSHSDAAFKLAYLLGEMRRRKVSGVALKDDSGSARLTRSRTT
jgi:ethanolamine ammonia-lyase small subunit